MSSEACQIYVGIPSAAEAEGLHRMWIESQPSSEAAVQALARVAARIELVPNSVVLAENAAGSVEGFGIVMKGRPLALWPSCGGVPGMEQWVPPWFTMLTGDISNPRTRWISEACNVLSANPEKWWNVSTPAEQLVGMAEQAMLPLPILVRTVLACTRGVAQACHGSQTQAATDALLAIGDWADHPCRESLQNAVEASLEVKPVRGELSVCVFSRMIITYLREVIAHQPYHPHTATLYNAMCGIGKLHAVLRPEEDSAHVLRHLSLHTMLLGLWTRRLRELQA